MFYIFIWRHNAFICRYMKSLSKYKPCMNASSTSLYVDIFFACSTSLYVDMMHSYVGTTHLYVLHFYMYYIFICRHVMSSYKNVDMTCHLYSYAFNVKLPCIVQLYFPKFYMRSCGYCALNHVCHDSADTHELTCAVTQIDGVGVSWLRWRDCVMTETLTYTWVMTHVNLRASVVKWRVSWLRYMWEFQSWRSHVIAVVTHLHQ